MSKRLATVVILATAILLLSYQNCGVQDPKQTYSQNKINVTAKVNLTGSSPSSPQDATFNATVIQTGLGGSCNFALIDSGGTRFEMIRVDPTFLSGLKDGDLVQVAGVLRSDLNSVCMIGKILQVDSISLVK